MNLAIVFYNLERLTVVFKKIETKIVVQKGVHLFQMTAYDVTHENAQGTTVNAHEHVFFFFP